MTIATVFQTIAKNRRARFEYTLEKAYEGGLVLQGGEVKALREGKIDLTDAFASIDQQEVWLKQLRIDVFSKSHTFAHLPSRPRKVLLHRSEIAQLSKALKGTHATLIPLQLYFKKGIVKVELAVASGKKKADRRADIAKRTAERDARAALVHAIKR